MEDKYIPPYEITDEMLELVSEIMENLGKLSGVNELKKLPRLRRVSRIKSIHSSLAIENNTLSIEQVTDVINGKRVLAPQKDIEEVHNAFNAYEKLSEINPYSIYLQDFFSVTFADSNHFPIFTRSGIPTFVFYI